MEEAGWMYIDDLHGAMKSMESPKKDTKTTKITAVVYHKRVAVTKPKDASSVPAAAAKTKSDMASMETEYVSGSQWSRDGELEMMAERSRNLGQAHATEGDMDEVDTIAPSNKRRTSSGKKR